MTYKIVALFGESGAGKDTIQKWIVSNVPRTKGIVSCTTRPKRDYEVEGVDYHFLSSAEFAERILDGTMLEATSFNDWFYGTPLEALKPDVINIGVFNIAGIECLLEDSRLEVYPIWIWASDKTRLQRALNREKDPDYSEICRRFLADQKDFANIDFNHYVFINDADLDSDDPIVIEDLSHFIASID